MVAALGGIGIVGITSQSWTPLDARSAHPPMACHGYKAMQAREPVRRRTARSEMWRSRHFMGGCDD
jgi:hypothetical protein